MKKVTLLIWVLVFSIILVIPALAEEITIVGTGDGVAVLKAIGEAFAQNNSGTTISVPKSIGSGGGIKGVGNDKYKIGRVARGIKDKEKPFGLTYVPFAKVPTVFFCNKNVKKTGLTARQICGIYSGEITNWQKVGGKNSRIKVVRREDGDSSLKVLLKTFPGFKNISITNKSKTAFSTPENIKIVEEKKDTIGFGPYDVAKAANVNIFSIDGKKPTEAGYPSAGTLALIFKQKNYMGNLKKFVEFATSDGAHDAIESAGGIPIK